MKGDPIEEFTEYKTSFPMRDQYYWSVPSWEVEDYLAGFDPNTGWAQFSNDLEPKVWGYDEFLEVENRRGRKKIDIPCPLSIDGRIELKKLVSDAVDRDHPATTMALLASLEVDLEWAKACTTSWPAKGACDLSRFLVNALKTVTMTFAEGDSAELIYHVPGLVQVSLATGELYEAMMKRVSENPLSLQKLNSRQFEEFVAELLYRQGWEVELTPATRDGGYDIFAIGKTIGDSGVRTSCVVECKRFRKDRKVGVSVMREILFVKSEKSASTAMVATTSDFTGGVYQFAASRYDLRLVNADSLASWCKAVDVG